MIRAGGADGLAEEDSLVVLCSQQFHMQRFAIQTAKRFTPSVSRQFSSVVVYDFGVPSEVLKYVVCRLTDFKTDFFM